jgi:chaperone modulatory protein CbpM
VKKELMIIVDSSQDTVLSLDEVCEICETPAYFIIDLIEYGIVRPVGHSPETWTFNLQHLQRIKMVKRVQHDLGINLAGAALVLELLDEIDRLRTKVELLDKYFVSSQ